MPTRLRSGYVLLALAAVGALMGSPATAADTPPGPFTILQVSITIPADEYAAMQPRGGFQGFGGAPQPPAKPLDPAREVHRNNFGTQLPWATADVTIGGETFRGVGLRYKGNGTIMDAARSVKKSFRVDLDRNGGTGRFRGSKAINLHCGVADPSKYREALGYALYRAAGVPAPITAFAEVRVTVPGRHADELLGLYTVTEEVGKPFLKDRFGTDKGLLLKPEGVREIEDLGDDWARYAGRYRPKRDATPDEAKRVIAFARLVHKADDATFRTEIASYLDVAAYLRFLAVTAFIANADSFFVLGHNYYLYLHPTTGRLHFIPWDLDRAFANHPILGTNDQKLDLSITRPYAGTHRLTERVLAVPGVRDQYLALVKELSATCLARDRLLRELDAAEAALKDALARDARAAAARKEGDVTVRLQGMYGRTPDLRTFVERRTASVAAQLAGKTVGYVPTAGFGPGQPPRVGDMMAGPLLAGLDADSDGRLSRDEWLAAARRVVASADKDADGRADQKSLAAGLDRLFPKPPAGSPPPPQGFSLGNMMAGPIVTRADADKDRMVTEAELVAAAGAVFDEFDRKKAGKLDTAAFADLLTAVFPMPKFGPPPGPPKKN